MSMRKKILVGILVLTSTLLAGFLAARAVRSLSAAEVRPVSLGRGRLEDALSAEAEVFFPQSEAFTITEAGKLNLLIEEVVAIPGSRIKAGDILFTTSVPGYEEELAKLWDSYSQQARKYADAVAGSKRFPETSEHNNYYNAMLRAADMYWDKLLGAKMAAAAAGFELPGDIGAWADAAAPDEVNAAMQEALEAKNGMDEAADLLKRIYTSQDPPAARTPDGTFGLIKAIDEEREKAYELLDQMLALEKQKLALESIKTGRDGWLTELSLKKGDVYNGSKPAYSLSAPGTDPFIRCDITELVKSNRIVEGMTVRLRGSETDLVIGEVQTAGNGKTYAVMKLDEAVISSLGSLARLMEKKQAADIRYVSEQTAALLPAGALRSDADKKYFVYVIEEKGAGALDISPYILKRLDVNVLETSDQLVAVEAEEGDLDGLKIAYKENKALRDGQRVIVVADEAGYAQ